MSAIRYNNNIKMHMLKLLSKSANFFRFELNAERRMSNVECRNVFLKSTNINFIGGDSIHTTKSTFMINETLKLSFSDSQSIAIIFVDAKSVTPNANLIFDQKKKKQLKQFEIMSWIFLQYTKFCEFRNSS